MYPTEPTPGTLSASHDLAHHSDIVPQSTLDARTSELSADDRPLLLARAPKPGAMLSQIVQGTYELPVSVKCKDPENTYATRLAVEKMLDCEPVHTHLKKALPTQEFQKVFISRFGIDAGIDDPKGNLDENLDLKDQRCVVGVIHDRDISLRLWATLRLAEHAPHDETPYYAALGTAVKYPGKPEAVVTKWVEFKMGKIVSKGDEDKVPDAAEHGSTELTQKKTLQ
ncbi:hypothetical protein EV360DRAFT_72639 [Lentinula raphanica]|nr:hypothetical protein EV360DRAFT_72639 [Lentinula raphanica]